MWRALIGDQSGGGCSRRVDDRVYREGPGFQTFATALGMGTWDCLGIEERFRGRRIHQIRLRLGRGKVKTVVRCLRYKRHTFFDTHYKTQDLRSHAL